MAGERIGFIGLGAMGLGMAKSLVRGGFDVRGFDLNSQAREAFEAAGGSAAATPDEAVRDTSLVVLAVVTDAQVEAILFGPDGAAELLPAGGTVVCSATVPPAFARALGVRLEERGLHLLDAPISGGAAAAEAGELTIMASGSPEAFEAADGVLGAMARKVFRLGDQAGIGSTIKAVNQLMAGVNLITAAEGMAFGVRCGADPKVVLEVLGQSAGGSWMLQNRGPRMIEGDYVPRSAVTIWRKDLAIVLDTARTLGLATPMAATAFQTVLRAVAAGQGGKDDASFFETYLSDAEDDGSPGGV